MRCVGNRYIFLSLILSFFRVTVLALLWLIYVTRNLQIYEILSAVPKMPALKMSVRAEATYLNLMHSTHTSLTQAYSHNIAHGRRTEEKKHLHVGNRVQWVTHLVRFNNIGKTNYIEMKLSKNLRCSKNFSCIYYFIFPST